jgi:hypothetical protein
MIKAAQRPRHTEPCQSAQFTVDGSAADRALAGHQRMAPMSKPAASAIAIQRRMISAH